VAWKNGDALYYTLAQERVVTSLGIWIRDALSLSTLQALTYSAVATEAVIVLCILSPLKPGFTRKIAAILIALLHGSIALCLNLGIFPAVTAVGAIFLFTSGDSGGGDRVPWPQRLSLEAAAVCF